MRKLEKQRGHYDHQNSVDDKLDVSSQAEPRVRGLWHHKPPHQPGEDKGQTVNQYLPTAVVYAHKCVAAVALLREGAYDS